MSGGTKENYSGPFYEEEGRAETTRNNSSLEKWPRKEKTKAPRKTKKVIQPEVERHHKNANDPQSSSQVRYTNETRT
jgi:hypothetical protein